jgi:hypothetical protein
LNYTCNFQKPTVNEYVKKKVQCSTKVTTKPESISHRKPDVEDIEYMHIPNEEGIFNRVSVRTCKGERYYLVKLGLIGDIQQVNGTVAVYNRLQ